MASTHNELDLGSGKRPFCPRCNYDLGGTIGLWEEEGCCPLLGKCSECGLDFEWSLVLAVSEHPWLYEYHDRSGRYRRFKQTLRMTYQPARFWREVALTDPVYVGRLWVVPLVLIGVIIFFWGAIWCWAFIEWYEAVKVFSRFGLPEAMRRFTLNGGEHLSEFWDNEWESVLRWGMLAPFISTLVMMLSFVCLPVSIRRAKVAKRHLLRVGLYTLVPMLPLLIGWAVLDVLLQWFNVLSDEPVLGLRNGCGFLIVCLLIPLWLHWQATCWTLACEHYLKLPHAKAIGRLLTIISGLAIMILIAYEAVELVGASRWLVNLLSSGV